MAKGSLSVFFAMILVSIMCVLFTMGECVRLYEIQNFAKQDTDMAVESTFSEYNPYLWANYKILAIDLGYGSMNEGPGIMEQKTYDYCRFNTNLDNGYNFFGLSVDSCSTRDYSLLTDEKGAGVISLGIKASKQEMASQIIDGIQGHIDSVNNIEKIPVEEKARAAKESLNNAKEALEEEKRKARESKADDTVATDYPEPGEVEDNPLDAFDLLKESFSRGVLATVINTDKLSDSSVENIGALPSHRKLLEGTRDIENGYSLVDKALFIDYLMTNYSYFGSDINHDGLKYEVEYLLSGKGTDPQCLASVVEQILIVRECANYKTILNNPSMVAQAGAIAETLAGFTMNPAIVEAVKYGVIGAWAYAEAVLDVRLLLSGGKVAPIKTLDQWTSDIWHLSKVTNVNFKAKDCGSGTGYKEYLMAFLALRSNEKLAMRALDIMENALNSTEDYKETKVDNMLWAADMELTYSAEEKFLSLFAGGNAKRGEIGKYYFVTSKSISY